MKLVIILISVFILSAIGLIITALTQESESTIGKCYDDNGHEMIGIECKYNEFNTFNNYITMFFLFIFGLTPIMSILLMIIDGD